MILLMGFFASVFSQTLMAGSMTVEETTSSGWDSSQGLLEQTQPLTAHGNRGESSKGGQRASQFHSEVILHHFRKLKDRGQSLMSG